MWILYWIGAYLAFYLIYKFFEWIFKLVEKRRAKIRDRVAIELFTDTGIELIIDNCNKKLATTNVNLNQKPASPIPSWEWAGLPKYAKKIANAPCPKCGVGHLKPVFKYNGYGRVFSYFACSRKTECPYMIGTKKAKLNFEQVNIDSFKKDFNQAYIR